MCSFDWCCTRVFQNPFCICMGPYASACAPYWTHGGMHFGIRGLKHTENPEKACMHATMPIDGGWFQGQQVRMASQVIRTRDHPYILDLAFYYFGKETLPMLSFVWFRLCCWMKTVAFQYRYTQRQVRLLNTMVVSRDLGPSGLYLLYVLPSFYAYNFWNYQEYTIKPFALNCLLNPPRT